LLERNAGMNLAFWICRTYFLCRIFNLLLTSKIPSSTFSILIKLQGLLRTLGNMELQSSERRVTAELIFTIWSSASALALWVP